MITKGWFGRYLKPLSFKKLSYSYTGKVFKKNSKRQAEKHTGRESGEARKTRYFPELNFVEEI